MNGLTHNIAHVSEEDIIFFMRFVLDGTQNDVIKASISDLLTGLNTPESNAFVSYYRSVYRISREEFGTDVDLTERNTRKFMDIYGCTFAIKYAELQALITSNRTTLPATRTIKPVDCLAKLD